MDPHGGNQTPHLPGPSLWPVGFAVGIAVLLAGLIVGWHIVALGAVIAAVFGFLWVRDVTAEMRHEPVQEVEAERRLAPDRGEPAPGYGAAPAVTDEAALPVMSDEEIERFPRNKFLEASTLGLGAAIGGLVTVPVLGFLVAPAFVGQKTDEVDLGPVENFPQDKFVIATFLSDPDQGEVSRRTAYIRRNPDLNGAPSFTIVSNRCVHLGCPVQPNGLPEENNKKTVRTERNRIDLIPVTPAGFGCPCHGGQYDTEGNRTAGPPVRALDRFDFAIRNGRLWLTDPYSVSEVTGEKENARIKRYRLAGPGEHVDGPEAWLYPIQAPH